MLSTPLHKILICEPRYVLPELQRYFKAAAEAAQEVLQDEGADAFPGLDISNLSDGTQPLDSPSRLVAVQLANGNPSFR